MEQQVRVGVVGAGALSQRVQLPALAQIKGAQAVAVVDTNAERARECAAQFGIDASYTDYQEMLAAGGLDAVIVNTPNVFHAPVTIAALEAGCHVLVEKPMATNAADAQRMADVARERGRILAVDFPRRFEGAYRAAREFVAGGELGDLYRAQAISVRRAGIPGYGSWFTTAALAGGGALLDIGVHVLDLTLWMLDEPQVLAVSATASDRLGRAGRGRGRWGIDHHEDGTFDVEDSVSAYLRCAGGVAITLDAAWAAYAPPADRIQLWGTRGGLVAERHLREINLEVFTDLAGRPVRALPEIPADPVISYEALLRAFIESVRTGAPPPVPAEAGVRMARLCEAIYESARTGQEVRVRPADADAGGGVRS